MSRRIHGLFLPMVFPAGLAPGEGSDYNTLTIAKNGNGKPVLRGTSLAGALRHAWRTHLRSSGHSEEETDEREKDFFGYAQGDDDLLGLESRVDSPLQVSDSLLEAGAGPVVRTHHLRNRHTGVVADGGLFSLEACPPGTTTTVALWLRDQDDGPQAAADFLQTVVAILERGLTLGGKAARGIGLARLHGANGYRVYELSEVDGYAQWLDDHRAWRDLGKVPAGRPLPPGRAAEGSWLEVRFCLGIPRGQDLLIGDGQGLDHETEPQRIRAVDGKEYWRLPGASLRGVFRSWVARLAAREARPVADRAERQRRVWRGELVPSHERFTGENLGWCFLPAGERTHGRSRTDCPVAALFGSLFESGRIHISDAYAPCSVRPAEGGRPGDGCPEEQLRMHVAVDRITGGAAESLLFDNTVLTAYGDGSSPRFEVTMCVQDPAPDEARWLAETLRALDLGILRVGTSKSSGRLSLVQPPRAMGLGSEFFNVIEPASDPRNFSVA